MSFGICFVFLENKKEKMYIHEKINVVEFQFGSRFIKKFFPKCVQLDKRTDEGKILHFDMIVIQYWQDNVTIEHCTIFSIMSAIWSFSVTITDNIHKFILFIKYSFANTHNK